MKIRSVPATVAILLLMLFGSLATGQAEQRVNLAINEAPAGGLPGQTTDFLSGNDFAEVMDCLIEPYKEVEIAMAAEGIVESITVERGDNIEKGQILLALESNVEKVNVELSRARVEFNKRKLKRIDDMYRQKAVSPHEKDEAATESRLAELELKRSIESLNRRTVHSPLTGVVVERYLSPGEYAEQEKVLKIAQIDPLNIEVIAPLSLLGQIQLGDTADIYPEGPQTGPVKATVKIIDQVVDAASGTFGVRLEMPNPDNAVAAGLKCKVSFK